MKASEVPDLTIFNRAFLVVHRKFFQEERWMAEERLSAEEALKKAT